MGHGHWHGSYLHIPVLAPTGYDIFCLDYWVLGLLCGPWALLNFLFWHLQVEKSWIIGLKGHGVVARVMGVGMGLIFTFLFWHLQVTIYFVRIIGSWGCCVGHGRQHGSHLHIPILAPSGYDVLYLGYWVVA